MAQRKPMNKIAKAVVVWFEKAADHYDEPHDVVDIMRQHQLWDADCGGVDVKKLMENPIFKHRIGELVKTLLTSMEFISEEFPDDV
jgi:hypothetical protein